MKQTILYLYSELMPYVIPVLKEYTKKGFRVYVVRHDSKLKTPYQPPVEDGIEYINKSEFKTADELYSFINRINPSLIFIVGWIDKLYCQATKRIIREKNIPVVAGSDTQWQGGKQWINVLLSQFRHKTWFTHILVAGMRQFEYAKRLGFKNEQIIAPLYSADMNLFENVDISHKKNKMPHNLLFVGRLSEEKGILLLLQAWQNVKNRKDWTLTIVGNGKLRPEIEKYPDIKLIDFIPQTEIINLMQDSGFFILPSTFEPWALVIHEAAAVGLPIAATTSCGATTSFLINNYNGFSFAPNSVAEIEKVIGRIIETLDENLYEMGMRSKALAKSIKPEYVAGAVLGVMG